MMFDVCCILEQQQQCQY